MNPLITEVSQIVVVAPKGMPVVYFLRLGSGIIYIGASMDLPQRLDDHRSGQACRTTQFDRPVAMLRVEACTTFAEARAREAQLKRWSRAKKEALVRGDMDGLRALSKSRENGEENGVPVHPPCIGGGFADSATRATPTM